MDTSRSPESDAAAERWAAAAGALLLRCPAPQVAGSILAMYLGGQTGLDDALREAGVDWIALEMLRPLLPSAQPDAGNAVELGKAWAAGRRSVPPTPGSWSPVVSGIGLDPRTFPRMTGETLISLIGRAEREIVVATAYVDGGAVRSLCQSLVAAGKRGVSIVFAAVRRFERDDALAVLEAAFTAEQLPSFTVRRLETADGFPHLKVLVVDGRAAYLGSANFTFAGMTTNFELGALVEGPDVEAVRSFVISLIESQPLPEPTLEATDVADE